MQAVQYGCRMGKKPRAAQPGMGNNECSGREKLLFCPVEAA